MAIEFSQFVDPEVTRKKFLAELDDFFENRQDLRRQGVFLLEHSDISVSLMFAISKIKPNPIAFAVNIDYTNWDVEPPSIKFIDPFSGNVLKRKEILINFYQVQAGSIPGSNPNLLDLLQGNGDSIPFFCIPGVREYHDHAWHSGDRWLAYRNSEEGKLMTLIHQLYNHSIAQASQLSFVLDLKIQGISTEIKNGI